MGNLDTLITHLAALPARRINMEIWAGTTQGVELTAGRLRTDCGTVGCIAGWTVAVLDPSFIGDIQQRAAELLNLTADQATLLFLPRFRRLINKDHVMRTLNHFRSTGEIQWAF